MGEDLISSIEEKIDIYKRNREAVPLDVLKTKYAKAYYKLVEDIQREASMILTHYAYQGIQVKRADAKRIAGLLEDAMAAENFNKRCSELIFKEYNFSAAIEEAKKFRHGTAERIYKKYLEELNEG